MVDWDPGTVTRFERYLAQLAAREARQRTVAEVGDEVETPDKRSWTVVRVSAHDELDLQAKTGDVLTVPREFAHVIHKA